MKRNSKPIKTLGGGQSGFTIIETLIVLAIGGLILMTVLLAIPALIRNSHNNQRAQDVQAILGAVSHWELNHSGNIPNDIGPALQASRARLSFYEQVNIIIHGGSSGDPDHVDPSTSDDQVHVYNYQKCDPDTAGRSVARGAGYSSVVALYTIETAGGVASKCQQL